MTTLKLSDSENRYIVSGCNEGDGIRFDGRENLNRRSIKLERSVLPQSSGSSRLIIGESTDILCSIKLEASKPLLSTPSNGNVEINIEISPTCRTIAMADDRKLVDYCTLLSQQLQRYRSL